MITERELRQIAGRMDRGVGQCEHEYAMLCVLDTLSQTSPLSDTFCLKGGTALRLLYYDDWRHSVDLDFSVLPAFPPDELRSHVERWFDRVGVIHGVTARVLDCHPANGAARMRAQYLGPSATRRVFSSTSRWMSRSSCPRTGARWWRRYSRHCDRSS